LKKDIDDVIGSVDEQKRRGNVKLDKIQKLRINIDDRIGRYVTKKEKKKGESGKHQKVPSRTSIVGESFSGSDERE
jgi:hypothetical protein